MDNLDFLAAIEKADKYNWISDVEFKTKAVRSTHADEFQTILDFHNEYGRAPDSNAFDVIEMKLGFLLEKLRLDNAICDELAPMDEYGLLREKFDSIDDIMNSRLFETISSSNEANNSIYEFKNVTHPEVIRERKKATQIGQTTACHNFEVFEPLFKQVHEGLKRGTKLQWDINSNRIDTSDCSEGDFFLLNGALVFIDFLSEEYQGVSRKDQRTLIIYENGTQSTMILNSLMRRLREDKNSKRIANTDGSFYNAARVKANNESDPRMQIYSNARSTGYVYIARTLGDNAATRQFDNLFKIGLAKDVEKRFKAAKRDTAFLMAEAERVKVIPLEGIDLRSAESAIHALLEKVRLEIGVIDRDGKERTAREWFIVPLNIIEQAVDLIRDKTIHLYVYDEVKGEIVRR
ncbi:GIY-YIG nuclease family protein [Vibrio ezurae]|uniref:Bacteriophage T5 Orf172 DNA-binding domain-containing protein n=1 Tax=Vibrio ezurae NBRC 102218 TaxID=1219080 RepID=U3B3X5_9VIBR|nr:GIY-YIG nuclease family protein [Vibrio ezurae]GAD80630.1 hypothetical protein VEZ01S_38_00190 [Vibrio ezurae NBRC 102218]